MNNKTLFKRDPGRVLEDVKQGYVSLKCAAEKYGVVSDEKRMAVDEERTKEARLKASPTSFLD